MDRFEQYLKDNKKKLEPEKVDPKIWLAMENQILRKKNRRVRFYFKAAAAATIAMLITSFLFFHNYQSGPVVNEAAIIAEFGLTEYNFTQQVSLKKEKLSTATIPQDRLEDFQILLQQLEFMDGQFQDYKVYIEQNGYQEFIGDQILNFYKSKIELLDKIQKEIEKINYYENKRPSNSKKVDIQI